MGSSGGSANPAFLSQGGNPMPNIPIAGQAGELKPQERGSFQEFLPEVAPAGRAGYQINAAGGGRNPSATGLTADMFKYRSPTGILTPGSSSGAAAAAPAAAAAGGGGSDDLRQQLAALQAQIRPQGNAIWGTGSPGPGGLWSVPPATS